MSRNTGSTPNPLFTEMAESSRVIAANVARTVGFDSGTVWLVNGLKATIQYRPSVHEVTVKFSETDKVATVPLSALKPIVLEPGAPEAAGTSRALDEYAQEEWARAVEREAAVKAWIDRGDVSPKSRQQVALSLNMSDKQLHRKIKKYQTLRSVAAFLPDKCGVPAGSSQLDPKLEEIMRQRIEQMLKISPDIAIDDLVPLVTADAEMMGHKAPGRTTIARRLLAMRKIANLLPTPIGQELKYRRRVVRGPTAAAVPLQRLQLDHTVVDVHIVEPVSQRPIGRPVLSLMLDEATRVVMGMSLSLEAPSRLSVGLCTHHAVMPKCDWLRSVGVPDGCWPGYGLMQEIYTDNAQEFHALSLQRSCEVYSIRMAFRPPGHPAAGGLIERAIGTFMTKMRLLPGSSYSKILGEAPKKVHKSALLTMAEVHEILAREVSRYHKTHHSGIGMPPLAAWEQGWNVNGKIASPRLPASGKHFLVSFLPGEPRVVTREGVSLFSLQYQSMELASLVETCKKRTVRYDPRDLSKVYVEGGGQHIVAQLVGPPIPPFSIWEHREVRRAQIAAGRSRDFELIATDIEANRKIIEKAAARGRAKDLRRLARQDEWAKAQSPQAQEPDLIADVVSLKDPICRVME